MQTQTSASTSNTTAQTPLNKRLLDQPRMAAGVGWGIHLFTGLGIVAGLLSLNAILSYHPREALFWLLVAVVIDGVDGPMARATGIELLVPKIDGYIFDLVIDYVTCVLLPVAFMHQFGLLPAGDVGFLVEGLIVLTAGLWFSRTDMCTADHWFRGFPASWNIVATTMYLVGSSPKFNAWACIIMSVLQLTSFLFAHITRVADLRRTTIAVFTIWMVALGVACLNFPPGGSKDLPTWITFMIYAGPAYYFFLTIRKTIQVANDPLPVE